MSTDDSRRDRIIQSRMRLRDRFLQAMRETPAVSDPAPQGSGGKNRHGMPRLPPGQHETQNWPVLDLGHHPEIDLADWRLSVDGAVAHPLTLTWDDFMKFEQVDDTSDFHCVTTWSRMDIPWRGVRVSDVLALAEPTASARHLVCHAYDGYDTNVPLAEALKADVLLVHTALGAPLTREHGGPVRMITPQLYAWKGAKWIRRLEVCVENRPGFWELRGYSNSAHPWRDDRYG